MKDALAAFEALRRTPDFFRRYLARYLAHADLGASAALADTKSHVFNDANFVNVWNGLLPADREPLRLAVVGITDIFSAPSRRRLGKMLGLERVVSKNVPQQSLRRPQDMDWCSEWTAEITVCRMTRSPSGSAITIWRSESNPIYQTTAVQFSAGET